MKKILCVRESGGLGDVLCTLIAVRGLRRRHPRARIDYLCASAFKPMLDAVGDLDTVIAEPLRDPIGPRRRRRRRMGEPLDPAAMGLGHYDRLCDFWCPANAAEQLWMENPGQCGPPCRISAFCAEAGVPVGPAPRQSFGEPRRWKARKLWNEYAPGDGPRVLVQQHSSKPGKDWPIPSRTEFARLAKLTGLRLLGVGLTRRVALDIPTISGCSVDVLAALCMESDCVVAPDSALWHMAAAVGAPCVGIFGPTDPRQYDAVYPRARWLWARSAEETTPGCRMPCVLSEARGYGSRQCIEEGACMAAVAPDAVLSSVLAAIETKGGTP